VKTQFEKNYMEGGRIHYFQKVTVNYAELKLYGCLRLQWFEDGISPSREVVPFLLPLFLSISWCIYAQGVFIGGVAHENFNNHMIYMLQLFHNG